MSTSFPTLALRAFSLFLCARAAMASALVFLAATANVAMAQPRQWTVDAQNRPGTDFTNLQTAFDAVPAGDRILVFPGEYYSAVLRRGLWIEALPGVTFPAAAIHEELLVRDVPSTQRVILSGFEFGTLPRRGARLRIADCAGLVHIRAVQCRNGLVVTGSPWVTARNSEFHSTELTDARLHVVGCVFHGFAATTLLPATPGVRATRSTMSIGGGSVASAPGNGTFPQSPALLLDASGIGITAAGTAYVSGGVEGNGELVIDPYVVSLGGSVSASVRLIQRAIPAVRGGYSGSSEFHYLAGELRGRPGDAFAVFLALPAPPVFLPMLESSLDIDPRSAVLIASGSLGQIPVGHYQVTFPRVGALVGWIVAIQGVAGTTAFRLSTTQHEVLH